MKKTLLLVLFFLSVFSLSAQTRKIEALKNLISSAKNNREKLKATLLLCDEFESLPKDTLWNYALKAKKIATATSDKRSLSLAIIAQANAYLKWDNTDSAKALIEPELLKYKASDPANRDIYFKLAQLKIDCTGDSNNYKDAIALVYDIMQKAELYKDSVVLAESMNTLCAFNYDMNFLDKSRSWGYKALSYTSNTPRFYRVISGISHNLGDNYWWVDKEDSAAYFINKDIDLSQRMENLMYLSRGYETLANIYVKHSDYKQAESAILKAIAAIKKVDGNEPQQETLIGLASVYRASGQIDKAIGVLKDGLVADSVYQEHSPHAKKGTDDRDLQRIFYYQTLAECYQLKGDSKNYEACLVKIIKGKDAFYNTNSAQAIAELETKYNVQKKEATIAQQKLSLVTENYFVYGLGLLLLLSAIIVWLVFREFRRKQKMRIKQLHDEEQLLSAKAVADAEETERRRIAADLHDNLGAQLSFIKRNVNFIMHQPAGFSQEDERKYLSSVNDIAQIAMIDLRETLWVLNKDEVTVQEFTDKLKSYLKQHLVGKEGITWRLTDNVAEGWNFPSGEVMHLFRIVQEVISNIIKHAEASRIEMTFTSGHPGAYQLQIADNGKGFDIHEDHEGHYGLENIENRANDLSQAIHRQLIWQRHQNYAVKGQKIGHMRYFAWLLTVLVLNIVKLLCK